MFLSLLYLCFIWCRDEFLCALGTLSVSTRARTLQGRTDTSPLRGVPLGVQQMDLKCPSLGKSRWFCFSLTPRVMLGSARLLVHNRWHWGVLARSAAFWRERSSPPRGERLTDSGLAFLAHMWTLTRMLQCKRPRHHWAAVPHQHHRTPHSGASCCA